MDKRLRTKRQTMIKKTLHRKLKIDQHEPPPPTPEVILTNFFAEPTVLLVPITSRAGVQHEFYIR
jgi:hypothetical protein